MKPFVKWAGGKTQLLDEIRKTVPEKYCCYYEPFLGGGAVLLDLKPAKAVVSDANDQLINTYIAIKNDVNELIEIIDSIDKLGECSENLYYETREKYNSNIKNGQNGIETAALLIWLNHHCFNGLYRTNREGMFNTPWNQTKSFRPSYEKENLFEISEYLNSNDVQLCCEDYKVAMKRPKQGEFVFFDPPYVPVGKYGDFKRYTKSQFYEEDQRELSTLIKKLFHKGVHFCLTNSNTDLVRELYDGFQIRVVQTHRNINSKGAERSGEDAIITA